MSAALGHPGSCGSNNPVTVMTRKCWIQNHYIHFWLKSFGQQGQEIDHKESGNPSFKLCMLKRYATEESLDVVAHFPPSWRLHNLTHLSLPFQDMSSWHLAPCSCGIREARCSWGCHGSSTHERTVCCNYSGLHVSQLRRLTGFLLAYDAVPYHLQSLASPRLKHDDVEYSLLITFKYGMAQGSLTKAAVVAGSFHSSHPN